MKICNKCGAYLPASEFRYGHGVCRDCERVYGRQHYKANSDKLKAYSREYHKAHRDEILLHNKTDEHRKKHREYMRKWRELHPDYAKNLYLNNTELNLRRKMWSRKYYEKVKDDPAYKEKARGWHKSWSENNHEKVRENKRLAYYRYQADKPQWYVDMRVRNRIKRRCREWLQGDGVSLDEWMAILKAHDYRCKYCGKSAHRLTMDHVIPLSRGGRHTPDNVVPACSKCNCMKFTKTDKEFMESPK